MDRKNRRGTSVGSSQDAAPLPYGTAVPSEDYGPNTVVFINDASNASAYRIAEDVEEVLKNYVCTRPLPDFASRHPCVPRDQGTSPILWQVQILP